MSPKKNLTRLSRAELEALARRFGGCGCKDRCPLEQYGESGTDQKPNGMFSVCEIEADQRGVTIPRTP